MEQDSEASLNSNGEGTSPVSRAETVVAESAVPDFTSVNSLDVGSVPPMVFAQDSADRKRSRRALRDDRALDDILGQITSKMDTLTTKEDEHSSRERAFIEVLGCSSHEATFYLESAAWNIEQAVLLWLDNNQQGQSYYSTQSLCDEYVKSSANPLFFGNRPSSSYGHIPWGRPMRWHPRRLAIEGLPEDWVAKVDPYSGRVIFQHKSGVSQSEVPPGFADLETLQAINDADNVDGGTSSASSASSTSRGSYEGGSFNGKLRRRSGSERSEGSSNQQSNSGERFQQQLQQGGNRDHDVDMVSAVANSGDSSGSETLSSGRAEQILETSNNSECSDSMGMEKAAAEQQEENGGAYDYSSLREDDEL